MGDEQDYHDHCSTTATNKEVDQDKEDIMPAKEMTTATAITPKMKKKMCEGVPMPPFFRHDSFEVFRNMDLKEDDIILSSGVKMGTSWVTKILNSLLHDFDDEGNKTEVYMDDTYPNRLGQTYPEAMPPTREVEARELEMGGEEARVARERVKKDFGDFTVEELMNQPSPRLFSTHLFGKKMLPKQLFDNDNGGDGGRISNKQEGLLSNGHSSSSKKGKGRLIIVVRNLKDTLTSLHHFRGVPKDGWNGNEHGPGSFKRWIDLENCTNAYGNAFDWIKSSAEAVDAIGDTGRTLVIYYEALKMNFDAQLRRMNDFLGLPRLTEAKSNAIREECSMKKMKKNVPRANTMTIFRKGSIGDWTNNYLDDEQWEEVDRTFDHLKSAWRIEQCCLVAGV